MKYILLLLTLFTQVDSFAQQRRGYLLEDSIFTLELNDSNELVLSGLPDTMKTNAFAYDYQKYSKNTYSFFVYFYLHNATEAPIVYDDRPTIWNDCSFKCYPNAILEPGNTIQVKLKIYPDGKILAPHTLKKGYFPRQGYFTFHSPVATNYTTKIPMRFAMQVAPTNVPESARKRR